VATTAGVESESILSGVLSKFVTCEPSSVPSISKRMALAMVEAVVTGTVMSAIKRMIRILLHSRDPAEEESLSLDLPKSNALQTGQQEGLTEGSVKMSKKGTRAELETVRLGDDRLKNTVSHTPASSPGQQLARGTISSSALWRNSVFLIVSTSSRGFISPAAREAGNGDDINCYGKRREFDFG